MLLPEWTEKVQKRGLDPLGLQNSGVTLYQSLVPGISNVTLRIRYYGLYCWASEAYAREVGSTDPVEWRTWVRRLEALHALVAYHAGGETGVAGVEWAQMRLAKGDDPVDFEEGSSTRSDAERYLAQSMGVFRPSLPLPDDRARPVLERSEPRDPGQVGTRSCACEGFRDLHRS